MKVVYLFLVYSSVALATDRFSTISDADADYPRRQREIIKTYVGKYSWAIHYFFIGKK